MCIRVRVWFVCVWFSVRDFDTAEHFETAPELVGRKFNRPRVRDLEAGPALHGATDRKSLKVRAWYGIRCRGIDNSV